MNVNEVIETLNLILSIDKSAISKLFGTRIACNNDLANSKVPVAYNKSLGVHSVGTLGIVNALFDTIEEGEYKGWGQIVALKDDNQQIIEFVHVSQLKDRK